MAALGLPQLAHGDCVVPAWLLECADVTEGDSSTEIAASGVWPKVAVAVGIKVEAAITAVAMLMVELK